MVRTRIELARLRLDRAETVEIVARELLTHADATLTSRPTWASLQAATGRSRSTIARALVTLRQWGLLGIVATGRRGCFAPGGQFARRYVKNVPDKNGVDDPINEAAVYVLCEVATTSNANEDNDFDVAVDINDTPTPSGVFSSPARTREEAPEIPAEPLRGPLLKAAQARRRDPAIQRCRPGDWFPTGATVDGKDAALSAARELRVRLIVLRSISSQHVRSVLRPFFEAGYTVGDIILAIDQRPDGSRWPHDAGHGVANVGAWLTYRMRSWLGPENEPRRSPSQRRSAAVAEAAARHRVQAERYAQTRPSSPAFVQRLLGRLKLALSLGVPLEAIPDWEGT